mmetsp:Transcript_30120/g.55980  ORF Transcript_30120/g.55980 Transcript_30120/m.55980 type:complete len:672 (-) Transcript_30120:277-2292(-)|eukprot:CAMPEP_0114414556 /NCGR_PEP_ID=MMETSP0103-20121206/1449_1 /TAXON_ID=37642 ORGANISM="Paraphysomonas imperforata, Strain PA2" /NCGR_SAMPLE_ID=MMETSP0103 /ASSEMBLY_ACC=CAM_ASM_000201 /LENGTH=671 /DNA_ID=CAMNT_0001582701 /DNA_START=96 /DNA_END=2111 /DNA_ORIENTATION=-
MGIASSKKKAGRKKPLSVLCEPTGLYDSCPWTTRAVARLVATKKIAPRYKGAEEEDAGEGAAECPICFLYYAEVNHVTCCNNDICTECYLQVKVPSGPSTCPFCSRPALEARYETNRNSMPSANSQEPDNVSTAIGNSATALHQIPSSPPPSATTSISTSQSTTPLSSSPLSVSSTPVVVSIAERQQLEQAMQSQRVGSEYCTPSRSGGRSRSSSTGSGSYRSHSGGRRGQAALTGGSRHGSSRRREHRRSSDVHGRHSMVDGVYDLDRYYGEGDDDEDNQFDMQFNLDQVEEMMLMEAIRLSMLESEEASASTSVDLPPPPPPPHATEREDEVKVSNLKSAGGVNEINRSVEVDVPSTSLLEDRTITKIGNLDEKEDVTQKSSDIDLQKDVNDDINDIFVSDDGDDDDARMLELALSLSVTLSATDSGAVENIKETSSPLNSFTQLEATSGTNSLSTNHCDNDLVFQTDDIQTEQCTGHSEIILEAQNNEFRSEMCAGNNDLKVDLKNDDILSEQCGNENIVKVDLQSCNERGTTTEQGLTEGDVSENTVDSLTPSAKRLVDKIERALSDTSHCTEDRDSGNDNHLENDSFDQLNRALFGDDNDLNDLVEDQEQFVSEVIPISKPILVDIDHDYHSIDDNDDNARRSRSSSDDNEESDDDRDVRIIKSSS